MEHTASNDAPTVPKLPLELLLQILELTCALSPEAARQVSLVASWARDVAKPYVFGTIIRSVGSLYSPRFRLGIMHKGPPAGCGEYVRHLWLETVDLIASPREIILFKGCPNVEDIALSVNSFRTLLTLHGTPTSRPGSCAVRQLTLLSPTPRTIFLAVDARNILMRNITHLRMVDLQESVYVPLDHLPNLTHLALPFMHLRGANSSSIIQLPEYRDKCPRLSMIILTVDQYDWVHRPWLSRGRYTTLATVPLSDSPRERFRIIRDAARSADARAHVILSPVIVDRTVCVEWTAAARGSGESIWEKAARVAHDDSELEQLPTAYPKFHI